MIMQTIIPTETYTCQICSREVTNIKDCFIEFGLKPVCSRRCEFRSIYISLLKYDECDLIYLWGQTFPKVTIPKQKKDIIYDLARVLIGGLT